MTGGLIFNMNDGGCLSHNLRICLTHMSFLAHNLVRRATSYHPYKS